MRRAEPLEARPTRPLHPAPTAFLWMGMFCLLAAGVIGFSAELGGQPDSLSVVSRGWQTSVALVLVAALLFLAQARHPLWRQAAGIFEVSPSQTLSVNVRSAAEVAARRLDIVAAVALTLLALPPRLLALAQSWNTEDLTLLYYARPGPLFALTHQTGYENHLLLSFLVSLILKAQAFLTGGGSSASLPPAWLARMPSLIFGVAAVPVFYLAAREAGGRLAAGLAAFLLTLSPAAVALSTQGQGYAAMLFFAVTLAGCLSPILHRSSPRAWVVWLVCALLGTLAHLYFAAVVLTVALAMLAQAGWWTFVTMDWPRARALAEQVALLTLAWLLLAGAGYLGMREALQTTWASQANQVFAPTILTFYAPILQFWGGVPQGDLLTLYYLACGTMAGLGVWYLVERSPVAAFYLVCLLVGPFLLTLTIRPPFLSLHSFSFALPLLLLLIVCGMRQATALALGPPPERAMQHHAAICLLCIGFLLLLLPGLYRVLTMPKQDIQRAVEHLRGEKGAGKNLIAVGPGNRYLPLFNGMLQPVDSEAKVNAQLRRQRTLWVLDTNRDEGRNSPEAELAETLRKRANQDFQVIEGRFPRWIYRGLDGCSDLLIYRLEAAPPRGKTAGPLAAPAKTR